MAYALLDDQLTDHPKVMEAGPEAGWLYICGLTYCTRMLTDGFIPEAQVYKLSAYPPERVTALVTRLCGVALWEKVEKGYQIHDYLKHNPTAAEVRAKRARTAERQARWKAAHQAPLYKGGDNGVTNASPARRQADMGNAVTNSASHPSHSIDSSPSYGGGGASCAPPAELAQAAVQVFAPDEALAVPEQAPLRLMPVPKPEKAKAPRHPAPPAVQAINTLLHMDCDELERQMVTSTVGEDNQCQAVWETCLKEWRSRRYRPQVRGPLDWYERGGPPPIEDRRNGLPKQRPPQVPAAGAPLSGLAKYGS